MSGQEQLTWQEQLSRVKSNVGDSPGGTAERTGERMEDPVPIVKHRPEIEVHRITPKNGSQDSMHRSPQPPQDVVEVVGGRLNIKSAVGEISIPLSKKSEEELIRGAVQYQQAIIREKRANAMATIAMAFLSGFSAVAIAVTLGRSAFGKKDTTIL